VGRREGSRKYEGRLDKIGCDVDVDVDMGVDTCVDRLTGKIGRSTSCSDR
jgi:hypothetical protein